MNLYPIQLLTIITLDVLENQLVEKLKSLGVRGYTISEAIGEGLSNIRDNNWEGRNIRIEILIKDDILEKVLDCLQKDYFPKFKMIAFVQEVKILRKEKFE
jgi:hypothetical protein